MKLSYNDAVSYFNRQEPKFLARTNDKSGYVCPACKFGNEPGELGLTFNPQTEMFICPNCKCQSDIMQLLRIKLRDQDPSSDDLEKTAVEQHSELIDALCREYGVKIDDSLDLFFQEQKKQKRYSNYIRSSHERVYQTDYFQKRGIGDVLVDQFMLGYDDAYDDGKNTYPAVILPTSEVTYEARNLNVAENVSREKTKYKKYGNTVLFNGECFNSPDAKPVFVCAGIFDALSVMECGERAVAVQSSFSCSVLLRSIETSVPTSPLLLAMSSQMNERLSIELKKRMISYIDVTDICDKYADINERLIYDKEGLVEDIAKVVEQASSLPDPIELAKEEYMNNSAGRSWPSILQQIKKDAERPRLKMGFPEIDKALDGGLYPGLYTLGAISSLGKTTFLLQVADNLAQQGQDVLFFSLEQSKRELMCKSLSRLTYEYCLSNNRATSYAKTGLGISDGLRWKDYSSEQLDIIQACVKQYQSFADHIFIYEGVGNISVKDIREKVALHIGITKNPRPIVMIDYLQVLSLPESERRSTDKQFVDYNITALRQLARDFEITVFCISALNRQSYTDKISMAAFKESGNIEYGSDVLMGLQFYGIEQKDFSIEEAKEKCPRDVELCILKNRNVTPHSKGIRLLYDARFNYFICHDEMMKKIDRFKSGRRYLVDKEQ